MKKYRFTLVSVTIVLALVVILMSSTVGLRSTSAQGKPALQKWEYCEIDDSNIVYFSVDAPRQERFNPSRSIAQLGLDGWEMVGSGARNQANFTERLLYFKRPKQ
jgi:hypothetical protein